MLDLNQKRKRSDYDIERKLAGSSVVKQKYTQIIIPKNIYGPPIKTNISFESLNENPSLSKEESPNTFTNKMRMQTKRERDFKGVLEYMNEKH